MRIGDHSPNLIWKNPKEDPYDLDIKITDETDTSETVSEEEYTNTCSCARTCVNCSAGCSAQCSGVGGTICHC